MKTVFDNIKGDRIIWAIAALLAIFSFLPVYSAASNLAYVGVVVTPLAILSSILCICF